MMRVRNIEQKMGLAYAGALLTVFTLLAFLAVIVFSPHLVLADELAQDEKQVEASADTLGGGETREDQSFMDVYETPESGSSVQADYAAEHEDAENGALQEGAAGLNEGLADTGRTEKTDAALTEESPDDDASKSDSDAQASSIGQAENTAADAPSDSIEGAAQDGQSAEETESGVDELEGAEADSADEADDEAVDTRQQESQEEPVTEEEMQLVTAASDANAVIAIPDGIYYLSAVTPIFGEYYMLDANGSYPAMVKETSALGKSNQWKVSYDHEGELGPLYRIQSASGYYLIASNNGVASITTSASTADEAYWYTVVSKYNGQSVVAFYSGAVSKDIQRALALVTTKSTDGMRVTMTVEAVPCGETKYPDVPDSGWLWYFTSATQKDWAIMYEDTNGATGTTAQTNVIAGSKATVSANGFVRPGYYFTGWNTQPNGGGKSYEANASLEYENYETGYELVLYAQWREGTATVTYAASSGGKVGLGSGSANAVSVSETVGAANGILTGTTSASFAGANAKALTGHHFAGWSSSNGKEVDNSVSTTLTPTTVVKLSNYADSGTTTATYHGVTVTANFDANSYTVNYDANGGTGTLTASSVTYGNNDTLTTASTVLSQDGYTFSGWNTKADGSGISVSDGATLSTSTLGELISTSALADTNGASTTLYAQWTANPTPAVPDEPTTDPVVTPEPTPTPVVTPVETPTPEPVPVSEGSGSSAVIETIAPVVEAVVQTAEAVAQPVLEVTAATTETLVTVGATIADVAGGADGSTSFVDALSNLTPTEAAQAATTTVTAVAAVSTVAGIVGAGASIAGAVAGAGAIGAGAAGAVGAASAADITAELAAESALAGGFFVRLRRRIMALLGKEEPKEESDEEK